MQRRRNYHKSPLYYPDDKDMRDFLRSTPVGERKLRLFLAFRGIMVPKDISREELTIRISRLILGWNELNNLVDLVDLGEEQEKSTFSDIQYAGSLSLAKDALEKVREERQQVEKESYRISMSNGKIIAAVDYIQIDTSKTPLLQGRPATLKVEIEQHNGKLRVTHTSNDTSKAVVRALLDQLKSLRGEDSKEVKLSSISLACVLNAGLRVDFFKRLAHGIDGFEYERATSVKVARLPIVDSSISDVANEPDGDDLESEERDNSTSEAVLKNVILQGFDVEKSDHYQKLLDAGFFVSNLTWDSIETATKDRLSFSAGFKNAETTEGFEFKVNYRVNFDNGDYKVRDKLPASEMDCLKRNICMSADSAFNDICKIATENDAGPAQQEV